MLFSYKLAAVVLFLAPAPAIAQGTIRVSVSSAGAQANGNSSGTISISASGRYVAFSSGASNLVAGDTNGTVDVFVHDVQTGATDCASVESTGLPADNSSLNPSLSWDARYVAFESYASNLIGGDTNQTSDVFMRDRLLGTTVRVSVATSGAQADSYSGRPAVSKDGHYVAFVSSATNLVPPDLNGNEDAFVRDILTGQTIRVSVGLGGSDPNGNSSYAAISGDGGFVVFESDASNLVPNDTNNAVDVFVANLSTGQIERISVDSSNGQAAGGASGTAISRDGRYVAFSSAAPLVPADTNSCPDVFVRDRVTSETRRVSLTASLAQPNGWCWQPTISVDGRWVAYTSQATNIVVGDTNNAHDIYLTDRLSHAVSRVSVSGGGAGSSGHCVWPTMLFGGRFVAFVGYADDLVSGDSNGAWDIFLRDTTGCLPFPTFYRDADGDFFGDISDTTTGCLAPHGYVSDNTDCDDSDSLVYPGAVERCNGIDDNCDGQIDEGFIAPYCTAGTTTHGCHPSISGTGAPSSTSVAGFNLFVSAVEGQRMGLIFYGLAPTATPWYVGSTSYLCVVPSTQRTGTILSGGTAGSCNGSLSIDWNAWRSGHPNALGNPFVSGQVVYAQGWFRDSGAPNGTNLSNGLRFTLCD